MSQAKHPELLFLDDLGVGQKFSGASYEFSEAEIKEFASRFDPQPFHLDSEAAKSTVFRGLAASGWHTASVTMRLLVEGGAPLAGGIVGASGEIEWPNPTRPGDVVHVESEVIEIIPSHSKPDRGIVRLRSHTKNQRGQVVLVLTPKLVVPRRS